MPRDFSVHLSASTLPIYMDGLGEEWVSSPSYHWNNTRRGGVSNRALCQITLHGEGRLKIGRNAPLRLTAGMAFLTPLPADHTYYYEQGSPTWHFVWAIWRGALVDSLLASQNRTAVRVFQVDPVGPEVRLIRSFMRSHAEGADSTLLDSIQSYQLLLSFCTGETKGRKLRRQSREISGLLDRMYRKHPHIAIGKEGVASELKLSRFQLYRAIKGELGLSPKEWMARQKIDEACRLLRDPSLSINAVARRVGVREPNYFSRFFRERTGHTPRDWRRLFEVSRKA